MKVPRDRYNLKHRVMKPLLKAIPSDEIDPSTWYLSSSWAAMHLCLNGLLLAASSRSIRRSHLSGQMKRTPLVLFLLAIPSRCHSYLALERFAKCCFRLIAHLQGNVVHFYSVPE